jgi:hypothetical protein
LPFAPAGPVGPRAPALPFWFQSSGVWRDVLHFRPWDGLMILPILSMQGWIILCSFRARGRVRRDRLERWLRPPT